MVPRVQTLEHALCNPLLKPPARSILGLLVLRYCDEGEFQRTGNIEMRPSVARLAFESGMKPDTVSVALRGLYERGYLELIERGSRGRGRTSKYRLILHRAAPVEKYPASGSLSAQFLGAKIPRDWVIYEHDSGPENTQIGVTENTQIAPNKTPKSQGANPYEPSEENPSRATMTTAQAHWVHELEGCELMHGATLRRAG